MQNDCGIQIQLRRISRETRADFGIFLQKVSLAQQLLHTFGGLASVLQAASTPPKCPNP